MKILLNDFSTEYGGIGDVDSVAGSLHRPGALSSHFVSALHRQRKTIIGIIPPRTKLRTTVT